MGEKTIKDDKGSEYFSFDPNPESILAEWYKLSCSDGNTHLMVICGNRLRVKSLFDR